MRTGYKTSWYPPPWLDSAADLSRPIIRDGQEKHFLAVPPHAHRKTVVRSFVCPADSRAAVTFTLAGGQEVAFTSYLGVEGTNLFMQDGLLCVDSRVRLIDVTDGTSQTVMVGERPPSTDSRFGWWYAGWGQSQTGSAEMVLGVRELLSTDEPCDLGTPAHFVAGSDSEICDFLHFWSHHPGGAHFLFADASVRFLPYSADSVLPALATYAGGETVSVD